MLLVCLWPKLQPFHVLRPYVLDKTYAISLGFLLWILWRFDYTSKIEIRSYKTFPTPALFLSFFFSKEKKNVDGESFCKTSNASLRFSFLDIVQLLPKRKQVKQALWPKKVGMIYLCPFDQTFNIFHILKLKKYHATIIHHVSMR